MPKTIFLLTVFGLAAVSFFYSDLAFSPFLDANSSLMVFATVVAIVFILAKTGAAHWSESTLALGVPVGLLGGTIGVTGMIANISDYRVIHPASAIMLLAVLYGGIVSALGHFATDKAKPQNSRLPTSDLVLALLIFAGITFYGMFDAGGFSSTFLSLEATAVFLTVFGCQIIINQRFSFQRLTEGALFAAILCLVVALILWYRAGGLDRDAINLAVNGLNYGLVIYILAYLVSLSKEDGESTKIETGRANWHWMEVTAFMIFMLFAPETLRETLKNEQVTVEQVTEVEILEQRFRSLEQRISTIENQQQN